MSTNVEANDSLGTASTPTNKRVKREPISSVKRVSTMATPSKSPLVKSETPYTPIQMSTNDLASTPFAQRKDAGAIIQTLDPSNMSVPLPAASTPILSANFDPKKYSFRPMYQKLSEVSEILDDQIDQYSEIVINSLGIADEDIGNPAQHTQAESLVIGRVVCDSLEGGRLNASSAMIETSRRLGIGSRTKLDLSALPTFALFPGQLIALKGINGSSEFKASQVLLPKALPPSASLKSDFRTGSLSVIVAAGPFTPDTDLGFDTLKALKEVVRETKPESVILIGPFIDLTHSMIRSGEIESQADSLDDLFQEVITPLLSDIPGLIIIPQINDALSRHACFPQEPFGRAATGLPKSVKLLPNPALFSLDEISLGITSNDILKHLTTSEISRNPEEKNGLARQASNILQQRRFYPLFPGPPGELGASANLDVGFTGLTEFGASLPDILICPSQLTTFVKVVDNVITINPGSLSKKAGPGTYAKLYVEPKDVTSEEDDATGLLLHEVWKRARIDIVKI